MTARLFDIAVAHLGDSPGDGFTVSDTRLADIRLYAEFAQHTVHQHIQMKLAHTFDNGLASCVIGMHPEGWIFFRKLAKRLGHFILVHRGLRLNRHRNDRIRKGNAL